MPCLGSGWWVPWGSFKLGAQGLGPIGGCLRMASHISIAGWRLWLATSFLWHSATLCREGEAVVCRKQLSWGPAQDHGMNSQRTRDQPSPCHFPMQVFSLPLTQLLFINSEANTPVGTLLPPGAGWRNRQIFFLLLNGQLEGSRMAKSTRISVRVPVGEDNTNPSKCRGQVTVNAHVLSDCAKVILCFEI